MKSIGFEASPDDPYCIQKDRENAVMIIALYVDDLVLLGRDMVDRNWVEIEIQNWFEMGDLRQDEPCLFLEIARSRPLRKLWIKQKVCFHCFGPIWKGKLPPCVHYNGRLQNIDENSPWI